MEKTKKEIRLQLVIESQETYISFLGKSISDNASYLQVHNMGATEETIEKGIYLRNNIKQAKENAK